MILTKRQDYHGFALDERRWPMLERMFAVNLKGRAVYGLPPIGPENDYWQAVLVEPLSTEFPFWLVLGENGAAAGFETFKKAAKTAQTILDRNQAPFVVVIDFSEAFESDSPLDADVQLYSFGITEEGYMAVAPKDASNA